MRLVLYSAATEACSAGLAVTPVSESGAGGNIKQTHTSPSACSRRRLTGGVCDVVFFPGNIWAAFIFVSHCLLLKAHLTERTLLAFGTWFSSFSHFHFLPFHYKLHPSPHL